MKKNEMIREIILYLQDVEPYNQKKFVDYVYFIDNWKKIETKANKKKKEEIKKIYNLFIYGYYKSDYNQKTQNIKLFYDLIY